MFRTELARLPLAKHGDSWGRRREHWGGIAELQSHPTTVQHPQCKNTLSTNTINEHLVEGHGWWYHSRQHLLKFSVQRPFGRKWCTCPALWARQFRTNNKYEPSLKQLIPNIKLGSRWANRWYRQKIKHHGKYWSTNQLFTKQKQ